MACEAAESALCRELKLGTARNSEGVHIQQNSNAQLWVVNSWLPTARRHVPGGTATLCFSLIFTGSLLP